jgi:hypothetical protein
MTASSTTSPCRDNCRQRRSPDEIICIRANNRTSLTRSQRALISDASRCLLSSHLLSASAEYVVANSTVAVTKQSARINCSAAFWPQALLRPPIAALILVKRPLTMQLSNAREYCIDACAESLRVISTIAVPKDSDVLFVARDETGGPRDRQATCLSVNETGVPLAAAFND